MAISKKTKKNSRNLYTSKGLMRRIMLKKGRQKAMVWKLMTIFVVVMNSLGKMLHLD
jgi:hypothetical protein